MIKTYLGPAQLCSRRQTQGGQRGDEPRLHKQQISQVPQISSTEIYITIITFWRKNIVFPASKLRYHGERDCRLCKRWYREVLLRAQSEQLWHLNVFIVSVCQKMESNRKQSLERGEKPSCVNVVQFLSSASAGDLRERGSAAAMLWFPPGCSRFPCCVLLALSWNTIENPSTDRLSRAIN